MYLHVSVYNIIHIFETCNEWVWLTFNRMREGGRGRERERERDGGREREKEKEREREREFTFVVEASSMGCLAFNPLCLMTEKQHQKLITT